MLGNLGLVCNNKLQSNNIQRSSMTQPFQTVSEVLLTLKSTGLTVSTKSDQTDLKFHTDLGQVVYDIESKDDAWNGEIIFTTPNHLWNHVECWVSIFLHQFQWGKDQLGGSWYLQITSNAVEAPFDHEPHYHPDFSEIQKIISRVTDTLLDELVKINQALREGK